jgi:diacylglycerol kinase
MKSKLETLEQHEEESKVPLSIFIKNEYFLKGMVGMVAVGGLIIVQLVEGKSFHQEMLLAIGTCAISIFFSIKTRSVAPLYLASFLSSPLALVNPQKD